MNYEMTNLQPCSPTEGGTGYTLNIIMKKLTKHASVDKSKKAMIKMIKNNVLDIDLKDEFFEGDETVVNDNYMIIDDDNTAPIDIHPMTTLLLKSEEEISDEQANQILNTLESCINNSTKENIDFFHEFMDDLSYKLFLIYMFKKCTASNRFSSDSESIITYISEKILDLTPEVTLRPPPALWSSRAPAGSPSSFAAGPASANLAARMPAPSPRLPPKPDPLFEKPSKRAKKSRGGKSKKKKSIKRRRPTKKRRPTKRKSKKRRPTKTI